MSRDHTVVADLYVATKKDIMFTLHFPTFFAINNETKAYVRLRVRSDPKISFQILSWGRKASLSYLS
jgi:hypothetical protein